ncbi:esterase/lipase family protein [Bacillus toyonensis]|uniref:triacylglycerol lipase n=1 Tax=Bacillus toyonensis TaxID=155322 RepID=A0A2A8H9C6_9BACI|nr:lipase [Bacillus toyonensis]PEP96978.1 lipase [Bacillus toyonensis]
MKKNLFFLFIVGCITFSIFSVGPEYAKAETKNKNNNPIILVHGFAGWGRDELLGIKYWGGLQDIQENLKKEGYQVYTASIGPVSSNWDRACELYAHINGGTVDYGEAHAKKHGHKRYGRAFPKLIPNWNEKNKIHLIGHSMGGQTIRTLVQLLKDGNQEERDYAKQNVKIKLSPLFQGGKSYVHSVTSLATPHNGTTLADGILLFPAIKKILVAAASIGSNNDLLPYDFKLDQWNIPKYDGESFSQYIDRLQNHPIWKGTKDISQWDLTTDGAKELNTWVKTHPDVYYFSYGGQATRKAPILGKYIPDITMNPALMANAIFLGAYTREEMNRPLIDANWWENDGVVNTISMLGPSTDQIVLNAGTLQIGKWNYIETKENWDHLDMVGLSVSDTLGISDINEFYRNIAEKLTNLPE